MPLPLALTSSVAIQQTIPTQSSQFSKEHTCILNVACEFKEVSNLTFRGTNGTTIKCPPSSNETCLRFLNVYHMEIYLILSSQVVDVLVMWYLTCMVFLIIFCQHCYSLMAPASP